MTELQIQRLQKHFDKCFKAVKSEKEYKAEMMYKGLKLHIYSLDQWEWKRKGRFARIVLETPIYQDGKYCDIYHGNAKRTLEIIKENWI